MRTEKNIVFVEASLEDDPNLSIRYRAQELGLRPTTLWQILSKDHRLYAYTIQLLQELKPIEHRFRREFSNWALEQLEFTLDPLFYCQIVLSDEAQYWFSGLLNK